MKKVLITGANSYIGTSFEAYSRVHYPDELLIDTIDMVDGAWRDKRFAEYDIVFHVAGIAHADVRKAREKEKKRYYEINTDLAIETCEKAKKDGVKQFVFMSSVIVYGDSVPYGEKKIITKETDPCPTNFYGDSKWQADKGVRALACDNYIVTVLRPPMIYGKGSKGNYPALAKMAKKLPFFPDVQNERSILFIENLCEFLCQVMIRGDGGVFFPQNAEYTSTSQIVKTIGLATGHRIVISKAFNWLVWLTSKIPGGIGSLSKKAFGNLIYDREMSRYEFEYQIVELRESILRTEGIR